ncbi:MAG: RdgB/HAM1 family non-canonical purine NTP pyrophosphatase [Oscillospiraceae bacterium]|nr:RdgB/HAM1 family non-canonical purine NTP pyrophosphatase [Oscillospiraceae bacterium]
MKLILATNNQNKLREFREVLSPYGFEVISQSEAGIDIEVEETGTTFEENAYLKAKAVYDIAKLPVIADDSGLQVDYLGGAPGVYSARYAEPGHRCERILRELEGVPDEKRTARFNCTIVYLDENGDKFVAVGTCEGRIGYEKRGTNGFGYDPIFIRGDRSFAELSADEKNAVSHRGNAIRKLEEHLFSAK